MSGTEWWAMQREEGWEVWMIDETGMQTCIAGYCLDKATAHRIAAVNEMEAALQDAMIDGHMNGCLQGARGNPPNDLCSPLCHKFRKALTKARGDQ